MPNLSPKAQEFPIMQSFKIRISHFEKIACPQKLMPPFFLFLFERSPGTESITNFPTI